MARQDDQLLPILELVQARQFYLGTPDRSVSALGFIYASPVNQTLYCQ
jgi:hypothetical protein